MEIRELLIKFQTQWFRFISENNSESLLYIQIHLKHGGLHFRVQIIHEYYILAIEVTTANELH